MTPRELRETAGASQAGVAGGAGVSIQSVRIYESNRMSVSERIRVKLDRFYHLAFGFTPDA